MIPHTAREALLKYPLQKWKEEWGKPETQAAYAEAVRKCLGFTGTDAEVMRRYTSQDFFAWWERTEQWGRRLAEFLITYGPIRAFTTEEMQALTLAIPYARALKTRLEADTAHVVSGGVGSILFYSTYTNGNLTEAVRMQHEAIARRSMG